MAYRVKAYTLREESTESGTRYFISFKDGQGKSHELEVSEQFFMEFRQMERRNRNLSNGTSGTGSLTRYGTKPFTDGRCVCLRALMNAWLRKNGMKRSIRRLGAFQRYKGGVSCSTTSMSSIFTKSPLWSIAPLRQYRNLLRLQRRK